MRNLLLLLIFLPGLCVAGQRLENLIQMLDYVGVDYPAAVANGEIIDDAEYQEMQGFAAAIAGQTAVLPALPVKARLRAQADDLIRMVKRHAPADKVADLASSMRTAVVTHYNVIVVPRQPPDLDLARRLFVQNCVACHGREGRGDGPQATHLEPPPTNFHERTRYLHRTLYGLYNTIRLGVKGTAMQAFRSLNEHECWSLAFYVGQLAADPAAVARGAQLWKQGKTALPLSAIQTFTTTTPADAQIKTGDGAALVAYLRTHPAELFSQRDKPLAYTRRQLAESFTRYREKDSDAAYQAAVNAYMEGFELVESSLDAVASGLRVTIEEAMTHYRNLLRQGAPIDAVKQQLQKLYGLLDQAQQQLGSTALTGGAVFSAALVILLREGLEALLVVAALAAFLIKTGRRDGLAYLHLGWVGALALGLITWLASAYLIEISGAGREMTEGVAALMAAGILFYVGFWMHDKTHARQWQCFIEGSVKKALTRGTLWGLAGLSFIAVYREVFETILFYQTLWMQTNTQGYGMVLAGMAVAAVALVIAAWLILRYSVRIPLRQFFAVSGVFLFILALILAGKGVAALQEAGKLPVSPISFPRIEILGIYPSVQGLILQLAMMLLGVILLWAGNMRRATVVKPIAAEARRITGGH
jgi:high-affinity iron transporter